MFLPHTLTAYRQTFTKDSMGSAVPSETTLYSGMECAIDWLSRDNLKDWKLGRDMSEEAYAVIVRDADFIVWDIVVFSSSSGIPWEYVIYHIDPKHKSIITNAVDNVYFSVKKRDAS